MQFVPPLPGYQHHAVLRHELPSPAVSPPPTQVYHEIPDAYSPVPLPLETLSIHSDKTNYPSRHARRQSAGYPAAAFSRRASPSEDEMSAAPCRRDGRGGGIASPARLATYKKLGCMPEHSEVYLVDRTRVLKTGPDVTPQEAGTLRYLYENTGVPVPEVLDFGTDPETGHHYILMERVDGEPLDLVWDILDDETKAKVVAQIRTIFLDLRSIKDPEICGFVPETDPLGRPLPGRYAKAGVTDNFFARPQGPFNSEGGLLHALAAHLQLRGGPASCWLDRVVLPLLFSMPAHPPLMVLTHGELNAKNILVGRDGTVTALLDWSQSGFYPAYWEFVKAFFGDVESSVLVRDNVVPHVLDRRYDAELAVMLLAKDIIW
ncbi:hypothetical protein RB595_002394 [Gaeumannomyces hyphopodioides]